MYSDFFSEQQQLENQAKRFCRYESIRDAVYGYTQFSLIDHLRSAEDELEELCDHWEQMEEAADYLCQELAKWDLFELAHQVKLKKNEFSAELEQIAISIRG